MELNFKDGKQDGCCGVSKVTSRKQRHARTES